MDQSSSLSELKPHFILSLTSLSVFWAIRLDSKYPGPSSLVGWSGPMLVSQMCLIVTHRFIITVATCMYHAIIE